MKPFSVGFPFVSYGAQEWHVIMRFDGEEFLRSCNDKFRTVKWTKIDWKEIQNYGNGTKENTTEKELDTRGDQPRA